MQHTETGSENVVTNHSNSYHRGSQTFSGHVPFSISADEYVPLKMGAGRIFSRQGPKMDFSGVGQKYFCMGGQKWQNDIFTTRN